MLDVVWDMETNDPDDFITLLLLAGHPAVNLKAVTVTPGSAHQVGLVRWALAQLELEDRVPVGARELQHPKGRSCVSNWHYRAYGDIPPSTDATSAPALLHRCCDPATTLITGGPLTNLGRALESDGFRVGRWVAQGGFAGANIVPPTKQLEKFRGLVTCPTFNLNADVTAAQRALAHPGIGERRFVSKNVCHGVIYDEAMHAFVERYIKRSRSLALIWQGMETYLHKGRSRSRSSTNPRDHGNNNNKKKKKRGRRSGKKLHDPLAACCAIDTTIATWAEVRLYRERGGWGASPSPGSGTWIIVDYDHDRFLETLTAAGRAPLEPGS